MLIDYVLDHMHIRELREVAAYYRLPKSGTKRAISSRITLHLAADPLSLISSTGPWYREQWNEFVHHNLGGQRRRSYEHIREEIWQTMGQQQEDEAPADDDLWSCTVASVLRDGRVDELAEKVGRSARNVREALKRAHGNKLIRNIFDLERPLEGKDQTFRIVNDRYQIVAELGKGGFASVCEAKDLRFPARGRVVLKFPLEREDDQFLEREIARAFDLAHKNICRYYDLDQEVGPGDKRVPFLVIEYGGESLESLFDQLDPDERFSRMFAYRVVEQISAALDYAADRHQIIHGDVNPGNILIGDDEVIRLTDFGLAARLRPEQTSQGHRTMIGTSLLGMHKVYSAPEVLAGRRARRSSDQYSLAMVFCAMMEGKLFDHPYSRQQSSVLTRKQNAALERALELDPRNRFPTCTLFAKALCGK